ncbi:ABC transporter ATP-binding protein [Algihabitans albus]|uniref:ABC transporter ATP-binding protein n=1 Tax=Algihabitans albus TaxID=2164067 RepID=UPI000E5D4E14|nr:ABC transporter ATP-binding protein [Algihabitans albus]
MTAPKLELVDLHKAYDDGAVVAVDGIDLTVESGETLALLGPSGCGKSTTLNMIVGLEDPTSGDIRVDGRSVVGVPPGQRNVGLVFQDYAVFTHMSVEKNLAFGLQVRGLPRSEVNRRVGQAAELLGLGDLMKEKASRLGGSQLQRVAIGRTLVTEPSILLLDEPLSNLEAETRLSMRRELRRLQSEIGLTIIYVTHDQIEALSLARRIAVMSGGKIRQCDLTEQVYDSPEHVFVAGFIGSPPMNLIQGVLTSDASGQRFRHESFEVIVPDRLAPAAAGGELHVTLGVRPEAVRLTATADSPVNGTVSAVEPRGPEAVVTVKVAEVTLKALVSSDVQPSDGEKVGVSIAPDKLVLFSGDTNRNLTESARAGARAGAAA